MSLAELSVVLAEESVELGGEEHNTLCFDPVSICFGVPYAVMV